MNKDMQPRAVRFTPAELEAIRLTAKLNGLTQSDVIRAAVAKVTGACPTCGCRRRGRHIKHVSEKRAHVGTVDADDDQSSRLTAAQILAAPPRLITVPLPPAPKKA